MARGDSFFEGGDGERKRKRGTGNKQQQRGDGAASSRGRGGGGASRGRGRGRGGAVTNGKGKGRQTEGSEDEDEDEGPGGGQRRRRGGDAASSDSDEVSLDGGNGNDNDDGFDSAEEEEARETPAQKRLRLAKQYLDTLKAGQEASAGDIDAAELERDIIAERLQKDVLEHSGKLHLRIADRLAYASSSLPSSSSTHTTDTKVHRQSVTCAVASEDCRFLFTSSKDGSIARWDMSALLASLSSAPLSSSAATPTAASSSSSSVSSSSSAPRRLILKTDFQPKRPAPRKSSHTRNANAGGAHAKAHPAAESRHFVLGKGKAPIARNQVSGDAETRGHTDEVYSLSLSGDGRRLCSGGADRRIGVWDVSPPPVPPASASAAASTTAAGAASKTQKREGSDSRGGGGGGGALRWLGGLRGHKDAIMSLSFRLGTSTLYSSSLDRTVKVHDIPALAYVETLFGHQDRITSISTLKGEVAVTAGARDKTLRYWKIRDESQLVFRAGGMSRIRRVLEGGIDEEDLDDEESARRKRSAAQDGGKGGSETRFVEGSVDATAMIDDQHFLSGGDSGTISLWSTTKKKPIFSHPLAHGVDIVHSETEGPLQAPRWITSLAALPYADLFASGSWDGQIRLWCVAEDLRSFAPVALPLPSPSQGLHAALPLVDGLPLSNGHESMNTERAEDGIPARGFVNSIQLLPLPHATFASASAKTANGKVGRRASASSGPAGVMLVAGLGQESKFGRWRIIKEAKNCAVIVVLQSQERP